MPSERAGVTHKFRILANRKDELGQPKQEWVKGYLTVGFYEDGQVGEIFIKIDRMGSEVSGLLDAWAISFSLLLQRGVPLEELVRKFVASRFEPSGMTGVAEIPFASSPIDYICRILQKNYVPDDETDEEEEETPEAN